MADWQIKPMSKKSAVSGADIKPGDNVVCAVFIDELGNLDRMDFLKGEFEPSAIKGTVVGKWERVVSQNPEEDEREARRIALAGSEDFFISLFDEASNVVADELDAVKQILALLLERKRILKPLGRPIGGVQRYVHIASKREFRVPQRELEAEVVVKVQNQIGSLLI